MDREEATRPLPQRSQLKEPGSPRGPTLETWPAPFSQRVPPCLSVPLSPSLCLFRSSFLLTSQAPGWTSPEALFPLGPQNGFCLWQPGGLGLPHLPFEALLLRSTED